MSTMSLSYRMRKYYRDPYDIQFTHRMPVIVQIDGKAFHTYTRGMDKPFDDGLIKTLTSLALFLCQHIPTVQIAYGQSDEISLLLHSYKRHESQPFFDNRVQKLVSVIAGEASAFATLTTGRRTVFAAWASVFPEAEVVNYFIDRQQDATRNSIQMVAQSLYSHKQLQYKNQSELQEMIFQRGINWNDLPVHKKRGYTVIKNQESRLWEIDLEPPIFTQDRSYIEHLLAVEPEPED